MDSDCEQGSLAEALSEAGEEVYYSYYDGSISGPVAKINIWLDDNTKSEGHHLIIATKRTDLMTKRILGLSQSHSDYSNFMGTLKENKFIDEIAFSVYHNPEVTQNQINKF